MTKRVAIFTALITAGTTALLALAFIPWMSGRRSPQAVDVATPEPADGRTATPASVDAVTQMGRSVLNGPYGTIPITQLLARYVEAVGPQRTELEFALIVRKGEAIPVLLREIREGSEPRRARVLKLLARAPFREMAPALREVVADAGQSGRARTQAARLLGELGDEGSAPLVRNALKTARDPADKRKFLTALALLRQTADLDMYETLLQDSDERVRLCAAFGLAKLGRSDGAEVALAVSRSDQVSLRLEAAYVLGTIGGETAVERLGEMASSDPVSLVRAQAAIALLRVRLASFPEQQQVNLLSEKLDAPTREMAEWAIVSLCRNYGEAGRKALRAKLPGSTAGAVRAARELLVAEQLAPESVAREEKP